MAQRNGRGVGAFGMTIRGVADADALYETLPSWPVVEICRAAPGNGPARSHVDDDTATWPLECGGQLALDRRAGTVTMLTDDREAADVLVHPRLGTVCGLWARWLGRSAFHAGAFVHRGGAWAVLGDNEQGKSTFCAALAARGIEVVTDDTLVVDDGLCLPGVRCIDLRGDAARQLGLPADGLTRVRGGTRDRLRLPPPGTLAPLRGWIRLGWDDRVSVRRVPTAGGMRIIGAERRWHRQGLHDVTAVMDLATLPVWEVTRPRDWAHVGATLDAVLAAVAGAPPRVP